MSSNSLNQDIDVFNLPVFADANIWSMWPAEKLSELADDIKDNGFDHRYPITIAEVNGEWMLLDGRNRREAAKIAGIVPPVIVTDVDPKLAVHRSNNQNRDATPGQKAMAFAMQFPEGLQRGRGNCSQIREQLTKTQENLISKSRYVLRNNPTAEGKRYPDRCLAIMAGTLTLTQAYEDTQKDVARREEEERIRQENLNKLADLRRRYPDLAALVDDDRLTLSQAIASAEQTDRETAEEAERLAREEEARLAEEDRQKKQAEREEAERLEALKASWFHHFNALLGAESLVSSPAQLALADKPRLAAYRARAQAVFKTAAKPPVLQVVRSTTPNLDAVRAKENALIRQGVLERIAEYDHHGQLIGHRVKRAGDVKSYGTFTPTPEHARRTRLRLLVSESACRDDAKRVGKIGVHVLVSPHAP